MEVLVEYEYIAVEEDELTIRRGDVISNVERLSDGWMEGDMDGRRGAFPDNFVKVIKEAQPQEIKKDDKVKSKEAPKKAGSHVADLANKLGHQGIKMGPPPNGTAAKVTKRDQSRRKLRAKVAFSYAPANDDELRLEAGDVVEVIKQEEEGWWEGSINGKTGMFPSNFVEVVTQEADAEDKNSIANDKDKKKVMGVGLGDIFKDGPISLRPTGEKTKPAPERTEPRPLPTVKPEEKTGSLKKNPPVKLPPALPPKDITENKKERARVLFSYVAENEDELSITEGEVITILEKELEDSGWWKGELNGKVGVFPDNFVDILPPEETKPKKPPPPSISKPAVPDADRPRPTTPAADSKPKQDEKKPAPALPTKKPAMPPPPISKKPLSNKHSADLIAQTDDHKVKESQKESGIGHAKLPNPTPTGRMGKLPAPRPLGPTVLPDPPKPSTRNTTEEIDLDIVPTAEPLTHPNANRAKAPQRRPPTIHNREDDAAEAGRSRVGPLSRPAPPLPKNEPPPSPTPTRSPAPRDDDIDAALGTETARAVTDLRQELEALKASTVPRAQYETMEKELAHLREMTNKLEKLTTVLMNDIDEGAKERRSMQVEIDRIRKLSLLPGSQAS